MFEGFKRANTDPAELQFRQMGFFIHFLVKKNADGVQRALRKFLAEKMTAARITEEVLGKVDAASLDKEFQEAWVKFRDSFTP